MIEKHYNIVRALFKLLSLLSGARAFPEAQYRAGIMPALPQAFLFIQNPFYYVPKIPFSGTRSRDMYLKALFRVHIFS